MKLIDADALIKSMKSHTIKDNGLTNDYKAGLTDSIRTAVALAENAFTIEAAPVVRGEWVLVGTNEHDYETSVEEKCSLCGRYVYRYDTQPQDNFCPNCGAKMEVEHDG